MWTVRTQKEGSNVLMPEYQKQVIRKLLSENGSINSSFMWKHLLKIMGEKHPSRASVIFFLNKLVDNKYILYKTATGKGGHQRRYYTELTTEEFITKIHQDIRKKLTDATDEIFPLF